ncbi:cation-transporting P-type ATPase [Streptomyces canus]|uniref:cation-transporting P-type ATPase n=1 Tax=Streptomyces canus TaxID=58343 RepID=UPI0037FCDAFF
MSALDTSRHGLAPAQALERLERFGANELPRARRRPVWRELGAQFTDLFAVVLLVASAITFLA